MLTQDSYQEVKFSQNISIVEKTCFFSHHLRLSIRHTCLCRVWKRKLWVTCVIYPCLVVLRLKCEESPHWDSLCQVSTRETGPPCIKNCPRYTIPQLGNLTQHKHFSTNSKIIVLLYFILFFALNICHCIFLVPNTQANRAC